MHNKWRTLSLSSSLTLLSALVITALTQQTSSGSVASNWSCEQLDFCSDRLGFEAIEWLHRQLDDDASGTVDITESNEFLRDELKYENANERQKAFHGNDKQISVDELWKSWKSSDVRNWTVEQTVDWLTNVVELPQYTEHFQHNAVDGMALPRLAANTQFISILGINNPIHKQKLALKAMDVVLFGAAKYHNYVKDGVLVFLLVIAIGGIWFAYVQHKNSQSHLKKMLSDMDNLQKAEEQLMSLQNELDRIRFEQQQVAEEKYNLEKKLTEKTSSYTELNEVGRVAELEQEVHRLREDLKRAQSAQSASSRWAAPHNLQLWLQLTHELEIRHYNTKRMAAEAQLFAAKEGCERLRKKRSTLLGAFRVAHGSSIDDVDNRILQAKTALSEVTKDLQERLHRWRQIEMYCGFAIIQNNGIEYLQTVLYGSPVNGTPVSMIGMSAMSRTNSEATMDDLSGSIANVSMAGYSIKSSNEKSLLSINNNDLRKHSNGTLKSISTIDDHSEDDELDDDLCSLSSTFTIGKSSIREAVKPVNSEAKPRPPKLMQKSYSEDQTDSAFRRYDSLKKAVTESKSICHSESCNELQTCANSSPVPHRTASDSPNAIRNTVTESKTNVCDEKTNSMSTTIKDDVKTCKASEESVNTSNESISLKELEQRSASIPLTPFPVEKKRSLFGLRKRKNSKHQ